jgi:hypothetical protein
MQHAVPDRVGQRHVVVVARRQCRDFSLYAEQVVQKIVLEAFLAHRDPLVLGLRIGAPPEVNLRVHSLGASSQAGKRPLPVEKRQI